MTSIKDVYTSNKNQNYEDYQFTTNVNRSLSIVLGIDHKDFGVSDYKPPKEHGLSNCNIIIPKYYQLHNNPYKIFHMDYYVMIKDDIRNCRILNKYQLNYIKELPDEYKNKLFYIYNDCIKLYNDLIND